MALLKRLSYFVAAFFVLLVQKKINARELHGQAVKKGLLEPATLFGKKSEFEKAVSALMNPEFHVDEALGGQDYTNNWAVYVAGATEPVKFAGATAKQVVYGVPNLKAGQISAAIVSVANRGGGGSLDTQNFIMAGWLVSPGDYGDTRTHFFTYWTADGSRNTGCLDMRCWGFILANNSQLIPGSVIDNYYDISIKIFKDQNTGDWWLHYGQGDNLTPMGYFSKWIFTSLQQEATELQFGGLVSFNSSYTSPPMGSGHFPSKGEPAAASFKSVRFVDANGLETPIKDIRYNVNNVKCYDLGKFVFDHFLYGGPGGCK
ncbi:carboxyl-terminal peptidase (DUF239) [Rhynchospora pubera]|uniref:Carboxyl-terminal peptidase (DUF239) n=1 Tax=Rhynchospora pubera TaxID=906938 RepID=A0AAV8FZN4_9POAL|nr:carboxyl-terminal peptidase (DUF239) [Rhynchospora pubera]